MFNQVFVNDDDQSSQPDRRQQKINKNLFFVVENLINLVEISL